MQLRRREPGARGRCIATSLAMATCSLLNAAPGQSIAAEEGKAWTFDTAVLYYDEKDRVSDVSAKVRVQRFFTRARALVLQLTYDTLTGASANGATPARSAQTFTAPSGKSTYTTQAGETPLDTTFHDSRVGLAANWGQPVGTRSNANLGASFSKEYDYLHAGVNAAFSWDLNERNTTLNTGFAFARDTMDPIGGAPVPLDPMLPRGDHSNKEGSDSRTVADLLLGVTQVFGPRTLGKFNYSYSRSSGYLTDPYKLVSVVDPVTGNPAAGQGGLNLYRFESRPDSRTKHAFYAQLKRHLSRDIVDGSYRIMLDDWGVTSHTLDFRYRFQLAGWYLQPHLRYYTQTAADFYRTVLFDGEQLPRNVSADYRLGDLDAYTLGVKLGFPLSGKREWGVRVEYYSQSGTSPPDSAVGALRGFDLFPSVGALILQVGYRF